MKRFVLITLVLATAAVLSACRGDEPAPAPAPVDTAVLPTPTVDVSLTPPTRGQAVVDSIQIMLLESFPVQVNVVARGMLSDDCTQLDQVIGQRSDNVFQVVLTTVRQPRPGGCSTDEVLFEEIIPLDVLDLDAGTYTVSVNGINGSFTLSVDNRLPEEEAATEEEAAPTTATLSGLVWHDLCTAPVADLIGAPETSAEPSEGCIANPAGGFVANGRLDPDEPGLEGVLVNLGAGACPSTGLATTTTGADGVFSFGELPAGDYCVSIDAEDEENLDILSPGRWTFPTGGVAETDITLAGGANQDSVNFGWDYEFLPIPDYDPETCTNSIDFIEDLSIPDDTAFPPGAEFVKSWRLRNNGACPWTTEYSLAFIGGDAIPAPETVLLERLVAPGQTVDLSVTFTAPEEPGTYRSNWQIADAAGEPFGINSILDDAFWVQIIVALDAAPAPTAAPNSAVIGGIVWNDVCRVSASGAPGAGCVETAPGSGRYRADGTLNFGERPLADILVQLSRGACPADGVVPRDTIITTTTTGADGLYRFSNLAAGTYCVSINAFDAANVNLLIPGDWTYPFFGTPLSGVVLTEGEERLNVDFGWSFAN